MHFDFFLLNILISVTIISIPSGILGSVILWNRMSYVGDFISHSTLFAIILSSILGINYIILVPITSILFALSIPFANNPIYNNLTLNIGTQTMLGLGMLLLTFSDKVVLHDILLGDLSYVSETTIIYLTILSILTIIVFILRKTSWILFSINKDFAMIHGINTKLVGIEIIVLLSIFIAISIDLVGALLVSSMLLIPSTIASLIARTPIQMVIYSIIINMISMNTGVFLSFLLNTPIGPTIVSISAFILMIFLLVRMLLK